MARAAVLCGEPVTPGFRRFVEGYREGLVKVVSESATSCLPTAPEREDDKEPESNGGNFFLIPAVFDPRENDGRDS